jgi:hypothetical protein
MDYAKLIHMAPVGKWEPLSDKLVDSILSSKNGEKMSSQLANTILHYWQQDVLDSEAGLIALLKAALLLEPDKTINVLNEMQMENIAEQVKEALKP